MKKIAQKIAVIFMVITLSAVFNGCVVLGAIFMPVVGAAVGMAELGVETAELIGDTVEASRYEAAAKTVIQYDEIDTFGTGD